MHAIKDIAATVKPGSAIFSAPPETSRTVQRPRLKDFEAYHPKLSIAVQAVKDWAQRKADGKLDASLIFVGPNGTGKTMLSKIVLWSIALELDDGSAVAPAGKFFMANDIVELMGSGNRPGDFIPSQHTDGHQPCPIVVIDDVGTALQPKYVSATNTRGEIQARLFQVINFCYEKQISLVLSGSNECGTVNGLADYVGPRSWDRLLQMAPRGFVVDFNGIPSYRVRQGGRS